MRKPSGRGASRAEEKGARNMAFRGLSRDTKHESRPVRFFTNHYPLPFSPPLPLGPRKTKHEISFPRNMVLTQAALEQRPYHLLGFLGHESRITKHESRPFSFSLTTNHYPLPNKFSPKHNLNASCLGATAVPLAWVFGSRNTRHETRITAFLFFTNH